MPPKLLLFVVATFTLSATLGYAGADEVTIVFETRSPSGDHTTTHYYAARQACFDSESERTLLDFATGRVIRFSAERKEYWEATIAEIEKAMTSVSLEMQKAMEGIPPSLRQKMRGDAAGEVEATRGETRTIAGYPCETHIVALGETNRLTTCATTSLQSPFDPKHFRNIALATAPVGPGNYGINKLVQKMRDIEGFAVASSIELNFFGQTLASQSAATDIRMGPIDPAIFKLPEGLVRVPSPFSRRAH